MECKLLNIISLSTGKNLPDKEKQWEDIHVTSIFVLFMGDYYTCVEYYKKDNKKIKTKVFKNATCHSGNPCYTVCTKDGLIYQFKVIDEEK